MKIIERNPLIVLGILWAVFIGISMSVMPLLPVDETRYMTVAWEMYHNKSWILPTLNFEPYSHKPPMLFWLINMVWQVTGLEMWGVRILNGVIAFGSIPLTYVLARNLFPDKEDIRKFAPVILMASPIFYVFGTLIMFDFLQAIFVLSALIFIVKIANTNQLKYWLAFGVMVGLGILAKGPVMLVHVLFPVVLAPLWASKRNMAGWGIWYAKTILALMIAAVIALSWALQAAHIGGEAFANEIFWSQSAGRMTESFAHQKPFWFYIPILFMAFLPVLLWPHAWKSFFTKNNHSSSLGFRFLLSWIMPAFVTFSLISGKQIHYLIPELPGLAMIFSIFIFSKPEDRKEWALTFWGYLMLFMVIYLSPFFFGITGLTDEDFYMSVIDARSNILSTIFVGLFIVSTLYFSEHFKGYLKGQIISFAVMSFLLVSLFSLQMARKGYDYYDLTPISKELAQYKGRPLATNRRYQGEYGFLAQIDHTIEDISSQQLDQWFIDNPNGIAIYRYNKSSELPDHKIIFEMPYKTRSHVALVSP